MAKPPVLDLDAANEALRPMDALGRLRWGFETFGERLVFTSSFGALSAGLCHLVSIAKPGCTVYFLETGFHFPETLLFRDALVAELGLTLKNLTPVIPKETLMAELGPKPYRRSPERCCDVNKVQPMRQLLQGVDAWISGVRSGQSAFRDGLNYLTCTLEGQYKLHPILDWTAKDLYDYLQTHHLPTHPLWEQGYPSIGCAPCTRAPLDADDERSGRWAGTSKSECGLHYL